MTLARAEKEEYDEEELEGLAHQEKQGPRMDDKQNVYACSFPKRVRILLVPIILAIFALKSDYKALHAWNKTWDNKVVQESVDNHNKQLEMNITNGTAPAGHESLDNTMKNLEENATALSESVDSHNKQLEMNITNGTAPAGHESLDNTMKNLEENATALSESVDNHNKQLEMNITNGTAPAEHESLDKTMKNPEENATALSESVDSRNKQLEMNIKSGAAPAKHESLDNMMKILEENATALSAQEMFDTFPDPWHPDTIQIYNQNAYHELIESMLVSHETKFTIAANGGSTTAGAMLTKFEHRYYSKLESFLRSLDVFGERPSEVVDSSHGARHSLHSAVFAPNFIPPHADLLFWEFAINDYPYNFPKEQAAQTRQMFLGWLREIERIKPRPPKVILIYIWKGPFEFDENGKVCNPVFNFHADIAKEFDFVVGHVNLASYIDNELETMDFESAQKLFLADLLHPNSAGHLAISFLLMVLLRGQGELNSFHDPADNSTKQDDHVAEKIEWFCGEESEDKILIRDLVMQHGGNDSSYFGWRSPLGTLNMELPQNEFISGSRQMILGNAGETVLLGKIDPARQDRQLGISMPCCSGGPSTFPAVQMPIKTQPMENGVKAVFLAFHRLSDIGDVKVYINSQEESASGRFIKVPLDWPCFWTFRDIYQTGWFAFSEEQSDISLMSLCMENPKCSADGESGAHLVGVAVY